MLGSAKDHIRHQLEEIEANGLFKRERILSGPQQAHVAVQEGQSVLNMCANNYLGLANHPDIISKVHSA